MSDVEKGSPATTVAIALAGMVFIAMVLGGVLGKDKPSPAPSPTPSVSTTVTLRPVAYSEDDFTRCVRVLREAALPAELCEPIEPREEDTAPDWSCRMDGNGLCGADDRWTWGIGVFA